MSCVCTNRDYKTTYSASDKILATHSELKLNPTENSLEYWKIAIINLQLSEMLLCTL